jgi:hypothetical protein
MGPDSAIPIAVGALERDHKDSYPIEDPDRPFFLAVSRAFLTAVRADDRKAAVLYSRAMLSIMNKAGE